MCTCIQVEIFYLVAAIGLFFDQLTFGPLRDLAQDKPLYLALDIVLLVVSSTTETGWYSLIKPYPARCTLDDLGK